MDQCDEAISPPSQANKALLKKIINCLIISAVISIFNLLIDPSTLWSCWVPIAWGGVILLRLSLKLL